MNYTASLISYDDNLKLKRNKNTGNCTQEYRNLQNMIRRKQKPKDTIFSIVVFVPDWAKPNPPKEQVDTDHAIEIP